MSPGHAYLDCQRYDMACCVTRERASGVGRHRELGVGYLYRV